MANKNKAKYGYLSYHDIADRIQNGKLDAYDVVFTKDTKEAVVVTPELGTFAIKSKVYVFDSVSNAEDALNQQTDTYIGQMVGILCGDTYRGYIVNQKNEKYIVVPLWESPTPIDYNTLGNRPIHNLTGTLDHPIYLDTLDDGIYSVMGQYKVSSTEETIYLGASPVLVLVEHSNGKVFIKKISSFTINDYVVENSIITTASYLTEEYLHDIGYMTEADIDRKIAVLDFLQKDEVRQYVEETVTEVLDGILDERIDSKINEKIQTISEDEISYLFQ